MFLHQHCLLCYSSKEIQIARVVSFCHCCTAKALFSLAPTFSPPPFPYVVSIFPARLLCCPVPALPPLPAASIIPGLTSLIGAVLPAEIHALPAMPSPSSFSNPLFLSPHQPRYIPPSLTLAAWLLPPSLPLSFLIPPPPLPAVLPSPRCSAIHHFQQGPHARGGESLAPCEAEGGWAGSATISSLARK